MFKAYFYYEVPVEKQEEHLKFVSEDLKTFFVLHGAISYDVQQNANLEKPTMFVAEIRFDGQESMQKTMGQHGKNPEYDAMVNRFFSFTSIVGSNQVEGLLKKINSGGS